MKDKNNDKIKILTFNGTYLPGYKAGGPIRSIANMTERLRDFFDFYIITQDRDFGDEQPYCDIEIDNWNKVRSEMVYYHSEKVSIKNLKRIINNCNFDIVYLNGFFSEYTIRYLILRKFKLIPKIPVIILPRGDLSEGALNIKGFKKSLFIMITKWLGLYKNLLWQATSEDEVIDIKKNLNQKLSITKIENLSSSPSNPKHVNRPMKKKGHLNIIFLSRITEVKNLKFALNLLNGLYGDIVFNIYGPISNKVYWEECKNIIIKLPSNIIVNYKGSIEHNEVINVMKENDVFLLPTRGENFGHVIVEALYAGCPVIISDRTPWRQLEKYNVGWDIPLNELENYKKRLQYLVDLGEVEFSEFKNSIDVYVKEYIDINQEEDRLREFLYKVFFDNNSRKNTPFY